MALAIGLLVALFVLLGLALLKAGVRNPRWFIAVVLLLIGLYQIGTERLARDLEQIDIAARGALGCTVNQVRVDVSNGDPRDVVRLSFSLLGYLPNYSEPVIREIFRTDRIVRSGTSWANCWDVEDLEDLPISQHRTLRWEAEVISIELTED